MTHLLKLPLLLVAAALGLALVASSASAQSWEIHDSVGDPFSGEFAGFQESGVLQGDLGVTCGQTSEIMGTLDSPGSLSGTVDVHFDDCTALGGLVSCDVDLHDETLDFHIVPLNEVEGDFVVEEAIGVDISCLSGAVECEFTAAADSIVGHITEGAPAEVSFDEQELTVTPGGDCSSDGLWTAHFLVDEPAGGLFIEHD